MSMSVLDVRDRLCVKRGRFFIDGAWVDIGDGRYDPIHPSTNEVVTDCAEIDAPGDRQGELYRKSRCRRKDHVDRRPQHEAADPVIGRQERRSGLSRHA